MFSQALTNVLAPAYDLVTNDVLVFDSLAARDDPALDLPMKVVVRGATAAPTYFEPKLVEPPMLPQERLLVDGGIFANNPGICALMQAQRRYPGADVVMVSLGTGSAVQSHNQGEVRGWGLAHWARPLFNLVTDSASRATHHHLRSLLGDQRYFRFEPMLGRHGCSHRPDDASEANLAALEQAGKDVVATKSAEIDVACQLLSR
jgi:hypothetical protein